MNTFKKAQLEAKGFVSLEEAKRLNNQTKLENAYVYDRYQAASMDHVELTSANVSQEFDKYIAKLPPLDGPVDESLFRLVPVDTFDTQEQIAFLIAKGHFYYAPEVGQTVDVESKLLLETTDRIRKDMEKQFDISPIPIMQQLPK
jgi:hypothetical protein